MEYRVEEIAGAARVRVDTLRFYQARGLLPAPRKRGRIAIYDDEHLERLRRIRQLQREGFSLAQIQRLLSGGEDASSELLAALSRASVGERTLARAELAAEAGVPEALVRAAESAGLVEPVVVDGEERFGESEIEMALDSRMLDAARTYLAEHCDDVQLHFTSAVAIAPGESTQILHRDRGIWGGYVPRQMEPLFSTICALTPFTRENGATQVVVGSHHWDKKRQPGPDEIAYAEMSPGSVLCYNGTVLHGGGANTTEDETRVGVFLHYTLNWLRQEENQYLSCPPEHAQHLSQELRALIGYAKGGYVLGFYSDPDDDSAQHESVSPENLFSRHRDEFDALPSEEQLVSRSTPEA